jgi:hypothetical protein
MSTVTATFRGKSVVESSDTPLVYNVSALLAATEYSQALSTATKRFTIRVRGNSNLQLGFAVGESATNFITIPHGCTYTENELNFSGTLYFQTSKATQIVEILQWT